LRTLINNDRSMGESLSKSKIGKLAIVLAICAIFAAYQWFGLGNFLSFASLNENQAYLAGLYRERPFFLGGMFVLVYILTTSLSLPGATILTLAAGAVFGLVVGAVLVSISSTIGATIAFLGSRFLFSGFVQRKFFSRTESINKGIQKEGGFYLFTLRLVPLFPFFLINLLMGLTPIRILTFFFVSMAGMLPGTIVYVNAGTQLAKIHSLGGIVSSGLILSFAIVGILPFIAKAMIDQIKSGKQMRKYNKPKKFDFNILVIGGGSAGLVSAYIAAAVKAKVGLIEKHKMGGDCLNSGCVPSKALIRSAKMLNYFKRSQEFGIDALPIKLDFAKVMERVQRVVAEVAPHDSIERYTALGVDCITGEARIMSPFEVEVNGKILTTKNIVVATGASPLIPPIPGLRDIAFLTSDNIWSLRTLPPRLIVLGGGPIGCELAQSFARFGSAVTIVEMAPRIMVREDSDVSDFVTKKFESEGIQVLANHKALKVEKEAKVLVCESAGKEVRIAFDEILIALGRKANVKGFGLEELGVELSDRGTVATDEFLRTTNFPNIYACGDVAGPFQFTHTASHQAWYVAINALFSPFRKFKADYRVIPWCTFTDPEVARVGINEQEAREKKIEYTVSKYGIDDLDRAIAEGEAHGFVKVLTPPGSDKVLGVTIVGDHAGDIIAEYVAAMKHGFGLNKILSTIHIYPTLAEANKYAAGVWKRANAPKKALEWLSKFHAWRRG
jgi:dihydrolipoamide dehydrogenase